MKKCANFFCQKEVDSEKLNKAKTLKFILTKEGCKKVDSEQAPIAFCDGTLASLGESPCRENYKKIKHQVENLNEGGPFGTSM